MTFQFEVLHQSTKSRARLGRITTAHGVIETPNFVAVGTHGTLKAVDNSLADDLGVQLMFCNTYHLLLQPGPDIVEQAGGLHSFIGRRGPIITDSGGFQVFSLAGGEVADELKSRRAKKGEGSVLKIDEEGVLFRSYRDGRKILLTPESSIDAQKAFGADIIVAFDELLPYQVDERALRSSLARTHRWEERSLSRHLKNPRGQALYAVLHGGVNEELRRESASFLTGLPFDGFAIGGSLGKDLSEMAGMLTQLLPQLPKEKPNHLLGIGDLPSLHRSIPLGIDTFDSSYPTRAARHGLLLTEQGPLKIDKKEHQASTIPICQECSCPTCLRFSRAYLHHLFKAKELIAYSLATLHNLYFMIAEMKRIRLAISDNRI